VNEPETTIESAAEEWRPVPGYDGWYEVSNLGRVRSFGVARQHVSKIVSGQRWGRTQEAAS
jgi:hypothetical protein